MFTENPAKLIGVYDKIGSLNPGKDADFLILDEPTRGIDIGTKTEIQKLVLDLADQGMAVAFISSEVEEMLRTCSRMAVMRDGKKVGEISGDELSQEGIMKAIAGGEE